MHRKLLNSAERSRLRRTASSAGFTLVEVLVAAVILGLLMAGIASFMNYQSQAGKAVTDSMAWNSLVHQVQNILDYADTCSTSIRNSATALPVNIPAASIDFVPIANVTVTLYPGPPATNITAGATVNGYNFTDVHIERRVKTAGGPADNFLISLQEPDGTMGATALFNVLFLELDMTATDVNAGQVLGIPPNRTASLPFIGMVRNPDRMMSRCYNRSLKLSWQAICQMTGQTFGNGVSLAPNCGAGAPPPPPPPPPN